MNGWEDEQRFELELGDPYLYLRSCCKPSDPTRHKSDNPHPHLTSGSTCKKPDPFHCNWRTEGTDPNPSWSSGPSLISPKRHRPIHSDLIESEQLDPLFQDSPKKQLFKLSSSCIDIDDFSWIWVRKYEFLLFLPNNFLLKRKWSGCWVVHVKGCEPGEFKDAKVLECSTRWIWFLFCFIYLFYWFWSTPFFFLFFFFLFSFIPFMRVSFFFFGAITRVSLISTCCLFVLF